jgi:hypothetical protein
MELHHLSETLNVQIIFALVLIAKGIDRLRSAVEGAIATISTNTDAKELDQ